MAAIGGAGHLLLVLSGWVQQLELGLVQQLLEAEVLALLLYVESALSLS